MRTWWVGQMSRLNETVDEPMNNSLVFESAVVIMGLPEQCSRSILRAVLSTVRIAEEDLHIQVLGLVLPQVEHRLRSHLSHSETSEVILGLEKLILGWDVAGK